MKLRLETLQQKQACSSQVRLFKQLFGEAVDITEELCATHASAFDWEWAARYLLSPEKFCKYVRVIKLASDEYKRVTKPASDEYKRVEKLASDEYVRIEKLARDEYVRVEKLARDEYNRTNARTWARLYNK